MIKRAIVDDFMTKTADAVDKITMENLELLKTIGLFDAHIIVSILQAAAVPGIKALSLSEKGADWVASQYVVLAALEERKRSDRPYPSDSGVMAAFLQDVQFALREPIRKFVES